MIMTTQITQEIFEAFLKCPTKSRLYSDGAHGIESEFGKWQRRTQGDVQCSNGNALLMCLPQPVITAYKRRK
jgi:hypothetical protein